MRVLLLAQLLVASCPLSSALMEKTIVTSVESFQDEFMWIFVLAILFAFFMAWGIGANDVANSFASSVGSKALTLKQAVMIATVVEFTGCVTMGASVTDTVRKGIIDGDYFTENPEVLMLGMLSALLGAGLWLCLCSFLGSPVSTTHSIIGSLIGVSLTMNPDSLNGMKILLVVVSWVASPVCSGLLSAGCFLGIRTFILRSDNAISRGLKFFPLLLFFTYSIVCLYTTFKNPQVNLKAFVADNPGPAVAIALGAAFLLSAGTYIATITKLKAQLKEMDEKEAKVGKEEEGGVVPAAEENTAATPPDGESPGKKSQESKGSWGWNQDLAAQVEEEDKGVADRNSSCELFPAKTEKLFSFLQVICASFGALAHGANDCANAVGPLAAIVGIYSEGAVSSKVDVPIWILVLGGVGISVGLMTYGYNVIKAIGMKLIKVTPSRGFAIEIGAFLVVIIGTNLGIPLSTTHCKVGATVAVGMCESGGVSGQAKGVNWKLMGKVGSMWVLTLAFASIISSSMFAVLTAAYHPMTRPLQCGRVVSKLNTASWVATSSGTADQYVASDMESLFDSLDTNGDDLVDSSELAANCQLGGPSLEFLPNTGEGDDRDVTVEKFGRRRRRTPEDMDKDDFLQYSCMSEPNLEHMSNTKCVPQCRPGYVADNVLECKLDADNEAPDGGFVLKTKYSDAADGGFANCIPHTSCA